MGERGRNARPVLKLKPGWVLLPDGTYGLVNPPPAMHAPPRLPWMAQELSRSERVIVFCELMTIASGPEARSRLIQKQIAIFI